MDSELMVQVYPFFLESAWVTIKIAVLATLLGLVCGTLGTIARLSQSVALRLVGTTYVSVIRGTPALIQVFILYFGGSQIGLSLGAFEAGVIALGVNIGAYMTESMRGAIIAVDKGQAEAARTLGLSRFQAMRYSILPQALRLMVRPLGVNINALIKGTALVAPISVIELTYTAQRFISSTYKPFEMFMIAGVLYLVIVSAAGLGVTWIDRKVALK